MKHAIPSTTQKRLSMAIIRQHETLMHIPSGKPPQIPDDFTKIRHSSGNKPRNPDDITKIVTLSGKLTRIPDYITKFTDSCGKLAPERDNSSLVRYCIFAGRKQ